MSELVTLRKLKIPEFVAYPVSRSKLDEFLCTLPQATIELFFAGWTSDSQQKIGGLSKWAALRKKNKDKPEILEARYGSFRIWDEHHNASVWSLSIYPVRRTILEPVKLALMSEGLPRLRDFLASEAQRAESNTYKPGRLTIRFDGQKLVYL